MTTDHFVVAAGSLMAVGALAWSAILLRPRGLEAAYSMLPVLLGAVMAAVVWAKL